MNWGDWEVKVIEYLGGIRGLVERLKHHIGQQLFSWFCFPKTQTSVPVATIQRWGGKWG